MPDFRTESHGTTSRGTEPGNLFMQRRFLPVPDLSLLRGADAGSVEAYPYPHLVIENALPDHVFSRLIDEFPPIARISANQQRFSNRRFDLAASDILYADDISPTWRNFIAHHSSEQFFLALVELFKPHIDHYYPQLESPLSGSRDLAGVRNIDHAGSYPFLVESLISCNTPVKKRSSVRQAHVDRPNKLFSGLYYLRPPGDNSRGGNLQLLHPRRDSTTRFLTDYAVNRRHFSVFREIPYTGNILVIFLNTPYSWHRVTPREPTPKPRLLVNYVAQYHQPLYDLTKYQNRMDNYVYHPLRLYRQHRRRRLHKRRPV